MKRRLWLAYVRAGEIVENALRALMPSRLRFVHYSWPLRTEVCPCDIHFCDYLRKRDIRRRSVFHFGPGGHHLVGLRNLEDALDNEILALTLAPAEHAAYVKRVIRNPVLAKHYKVLFADIYSLSGRSLPRFDVVTLFHLAEFGGMANASRRLDDDDVLKLFLAQLAPGGLLLFYTGSFGYAKIVPLLEHAVAQHELAFLENYQSLAVYRRTPTCG
jgi:hypothetical protein